MSAARRANNDEPVGQCRVLSLDEGKPFIKRRPRLKVQNFEIPGNMASDNCDTATIVAKESAQFIVGGNASLIFLPSFDSRSLRPIGANRNDAQTRTGVCNSNIEC